MSGEVTLGKDTVLRGTVIIVANEGEVRDISLSLFSFSIVHVACSFGWVCGCVGKE